MAIKYFLFKTNKADLPLIHILRKEAEKNYNNWPKIKEIFEKLPYAFFNELKLINFLIKNPTNYKEALLQIKDQVEMWIYAYSSFLFNKYLSEYSLEYGCVDEKFPILLNNPKENYDLYKKYLELDNTQNFKKHIGLFAHKQNKQRFVKARIFTKNIEYKIFDHGVVINFELPKGAYATTFLSNLFAIYQDSPIPKNINLTDFDAKQIINKGNLNELKNKFADIWKKEI